MWTPILLFDVKNSWKLFLRFAPCLLHSKVILPLYLFLQWTSSWSSCFENVMNFIFLGIFIFEPRPRMPLGLSSKSSCDIYTSFNFLKFTFFLLLFLSICRGLVVLNAKKKYKNSSNFLNFVWSQLCFENVLKQQILRLLKKYVNGISDVKSIQMFHVENKDILSRGFLNIKEQTLLSLQLSSFTNFSDFSGFFDLLLES